MTGRVRTLSTADAVAFRVVRLEALRSAPGAYGSTLADWARLPLSAYIARIEEGVILGLFTDKGLEGLLAYDRDKGGNARHRASLHAAYVRATLRGTGAMDALVAAAVAQAKTDGVVQLELTVAANNAPAIAAWTRNGFDRIGVMPRALLLGGNYVDELVMLRRLDG